MIAPTLTLPSLAAKSQQEASCGHQPIRRRRGGGDGEPGQTGAPTRPLLIVVAETSQRRGKFSAHLGDDRKLLSSSRQPLLDVARVLLAEGIPPETPIAMQHKGSAIIAMTSTVGEAAKLTVKEGPVGPRFRKWELFPAVRSARTGDESDEG